MRIDFVTLFPDMVLGALAHSMIRRATERGLLRVGAANPRDFAYDAHKTVDDSPYGGGAGMVMKPEPVAAAIRWAVWEGRGTRDESLGIGGDRRATGDSGPSEPCTPNPKPRALPPGAAVVLTDPIGRLFDQAAAEELAGFEQVVFVCGHYEGIDDRIRTQYATHVFSIGDFILTGGELPALVMADAVARLVPGVLGSEDSLRQDSHRDGLLSAPQFTRPECFEGVEVPEVLRSGNHREAAKWKRRQSLLLTRQNRPDLFCKAGMAKPDLDLLSL